MKTAGRSPGNRGPSSFLSRRARRAHLLTTASSQTPYPSPRRKRQVSSIPLCLLFPQSLATLWEPFFAAVVALPLVGHVRSPRGIAAPAGAAGRCHSLVGAAVIVHATGSVMGWQNAISHSHRLPASTCHRQLDTDTGVERIVTPLLLGCRDSRRPFGKKG